MFALLKKPAAATAPAVQDVEPALDARALINDINREASTLGRDAAQVRGAIDWLCSWQMRLSVTPSTAAISLRFMSCS